MTGGILVTAGLIGVTYGLMNGPANGWTQPSPLARRSPERCCSHGSRPTNAALRMPMLPLSLLTFAQFTAANVVTFIVYAALGGALFLLSIEPQQAPGYTPLQAGISLLPVTAIMLALPARSGALAARIGPRLQMCTGPVVIAGHGSSPPACAWPAVRWPPSPSAAPAQSQAPHHASCCTAR